MAINVNLIPQIQTVTDLNGITLTLSSAQIIKVKEVDAGTIVTYLANRGAGNIKNVTVSESQATIITGSGGRLQSIYSNDEAAQIAINSNYIIYLDQKTSESIVTYYNFTNVPDILHIDDDASAMNTAARNTFAVTTVTTPNIPSQTRYINSLFVDLISQIANTSSTDLSLTSAILVAPGTGWIPTETFSFAGGTAIDAATGIVDTTQLVSGALTAAGTGADPTLTLHVNGGTGTAAQMSFHSTVVSITATPVAPGASYNVGDTVNPDGGTGTKAVFTVTHIKAVDKPAVGAGGAGYVTGDHVSLTTGTGTQAVFTVIAAAGAVTSVSAVFSAGDYTVRPTLGATVATTAVTGIGTGLTVNAIAADFGALTIANTTPGSYTVNPTAVTASATTAVTGTGTGMTATFVMGVLTGTLVVVVPGSYTVNPTLTNNAVTTGATGATVTIVMGINTFHITDGGSYSVAPTNPTAENRASGSGTGATFTTTFTGIQTQILYDSKLPSYTKLTVQETKVELIAAQNAL